MSISQIRISDVLILQGFVTVTWISSPSPLAPGGKGVVYFGAEGEGKVRVLFQDYSNNRSGNIIQNDWNNWCYCDVTVYRNRVTYVEGSTSDVELEIGKQFAYHATAYPENATNREVFYVPNHPSIATVSADGTITAVAPGNMILYAFSEDDNRCFDTCFVKVNEPVPVQTPTPAPTPTPTPATAPTIYSEDPPSNVADSSVNFGD